MPFMYEPCPHNQLNPHPHAIQLPSPLQAGQYARPKTAYDAARTIFADTQGHPCEERARTPGSCAPGNIRREVSNERTDQGTDRPARAEGRLHPRSTDRGDARIRPTVARRHHSHSIASILLSRHSSCIQPSASVRNAYRRATRRRIPSASGTEAGTASKTHLKTQGVEFSFLSQRALRMVFADSIAPKTPVSKLKRPFVC